MGVEKLFDFALFCITDDQESEFLCGYNFLSIGNRDRQQNQWNS